MNLRETMTYLLDLPLVDALWWYIENVVTEHPHANDLFFLLRKRVREHYRLTNEDQ